MNSLVGVLIAILITVVAERAARLILARFHVRNSQVLNYEIILTAVLFVLLLDTRLSASAGKQEHPDHFGALLWAFSALSGISICLLFLDSLVERMAGGAAGSGKSEPRVGGRHPRGRETTRKRKG